jgi:hypothetical protein
MALDAFAATAILEAIGHHRRTVAAKRPIVPRIGPQPGLSRLACSGSERRQGRLIGEDPLTLLDLRKYIIGRARNHIDMERVAAVRRKTPQECSPLRIFEDCTPGPVWSSGGDATHHGRHAEKAANPFFREWRGVAAVRYHCKITLSK